ncbi:MAG TPA: aminomethyl-transferring glycine dehydrogenase subunit GcvPA [Anaerolineae bacterium]|nr:aminomethyl-transferring glycine dehydrogenase subunit GcvPA [Anaerolineae bacterium]HQK14681.1 aminomethyl-transferring glycine dehydrogenase subunit GcvPA [Anaerolineae bacterium]
MVYIPHTDAERQEMLAAIGVNNLDALFQDIPEKFRYPQLDLPAPLSEMEILQELQFLAALNVNANVVPTFLGAGAYRHWVPSVVDYVISRGEFYTAYTPYQAEVSQGTLQAIFEYESMICDLTGMDVANASHYDGATATAEAVIQAYNVFRKKRAKVVIAPTVHPHYRQVVHTYTQGMGLDIVGGDDPMMPLEQLIALVDENTACLILQTPDFLGRLVNLEGIAEQVHARGKGTLLAVVVNPISLGLLKPPGAYGADIVLGEGQPLGLGLNFGGPYLGFYATRDEYVRQMAGRLVGKTVDVEGKDGYVMTLTTREQHIRRDKATSNICSNEGLMALAATVYMAALGKHGLRKIAELNYHKAHYAADVIDKIPGFSVVKTHPFFNEFMVRCPAQVADINHFLLNDIEEVEIVGGYDLGRDYPGLQRHMLVAVTEVNSRHEIDLFAEALGAFTAEEQEA